MTTARKRIIIAFLTAIFILVGCSSAEQTPAPTPDLNILVELVAQRVVVTLQAQMTQDAIDNPTATPIPTATPEPTSTPTPIPTIVVASPTVQFVGEKAEFLYAVTYPGNRTTFVPNEEINIAWGLKNAGSTTWTPGYKLTYVGGEAFTARYEIRLEKNVAPGEKAEFNFGAFGSEELGSHTTYWQLVNANGLPVPGGYVSFTYTSE